MSLIDITKPVSGNPTTQSVRDNFAAAAAEIDALDSAVTTLQGSVSGFDSHLIDTNNPHVVTKNQIGLGNADNTSDANKPISTAAQTALNSKADSSALSAHVVDTGNPHAVTKAQIGLNNVDNTSDLNKPISTATQAALDAKQNALINSDGLAEGTTNIYFTPSRVLNTVITGLSTATNTIITASDNVLSAIGKLQKQISDNLATLTSHTSNTSNPHNATAAQVGAAASGAVTTSGLTMSTARLLGRNTASTGAIEEITLGTNLSFSGTTLNAFSAPTTAQVQAMFAASDLGLLYDVSDIATLYQDVAGATRVTSLDQSVRRVSDMSGKNAPALFLSGSAVPKYTRRCNQLVATDAFDDVAWARVGTAPTVTLNAALNPWGVMTASQLAFSASGSGNRLNQSNAGNNNQRNTVSVYLKGTVGGEQIVIWNGWTKTLLCTLTTSWQRFTLSETVLVASTGLYIYAQSGTPTIYACGAMVNQGTTAAPYQSVTPTGVYDAAFWPYSVSMGDGSLTTTFSASLGSSCTVALARPRIGAEILTAQTIGTTYVDVFDYAARLIINRALTAPETALVTAWLNHKAGV